MKPLVKIYHDHHQHSEFLQDINCIHDEKYHPCPLIICVIIGNILAFPSTQTCSCFVLYLEILAIQLMLCSTLECCYLLCQECHGKFTTLKNSWYKWYLLTSPFFSWSPCYSNQKTDNRTMMCEFKTSSNPIALKLMVDSSFLDYWLWNHHSNIDHATYPHILGAPFDQCLIVYIFLEHTSLYHLIWLMLSPCSHDCGNPSFWKSQWYVAESITHLLILSLV